MVFYIMSTIIKRGNEVKKLEKWSRLWKRNTKKNYDEFELYIPVDIF